MDTDKDMPNKEVGITRRGFVKGVLGILGLGTVAAVAPGCEKAPSDLQTRVAEGILKPGDDQTVEAVIETATSLSKDPPSATAEVEPTVRVPAPTQVEVVPTPSPVPATPTQGPIFTGIQPTYTPTPEGWSPTKVPTSTPAEPTNTPRPITNQPSTWTPDAGATATELAKPPTLTPRPATATPVSVALKPTNTPKPVEAPKAPETGGVKESVIDTGTGLRVISKGTRYLLYTGPRDKWHTGATNKGGIGQANFDYLKDMFAKYAKGNKLEIRFYDSPELNPHQSASARIASTHFKFVTKSGGSEILHISLSENFTLGGENSFIFLGNLNLDIRNFLVAISGFNQEIARITLPYRVFLTPLA